MAALQLFALLSVVGSLVHLRLGGDCSGAGESGKSTILKQMKKIHGSSMLVRPVPLSHTRTIAPHSLPRSSPTHIAPHSFQPIHALHPGHPLIPAFCAPVGPGKGFDDQREDAAILVRRNVRSNVGVCGGPAPSSPPLLPVVPNLDHPAWPHILSCANTLAPTPFASQPPSMCLPSKWFGPGLVRLVRCSVVSLSQSVSLSSCGSSLLLLAAQID